MTPSLRRSVRERPIPTFSFSPFLRPWICRAVFLVLAVWGGPSGVEGADWPQFLGPGRDGRTTETIAAKLPADGPRRVWTASVGEGFSSPVVSGDRVFLFHRQGEEEVLACYRAGDGTVLWRSAAPATYRDDFGFEAGPRSTPTVVSNRVVTFGADGRLAAVAVDSGKTVWSVDVKKAYGAEKGFFGFACSPLVEGGVVIVQVGGEKGGGIVGVELETGRERWRATEDEASYSAPIAVTESDGSRVAYCYTRKGLVALNPKDGKVAFEFGWRPAMSASVNAASPVWVGPGLVFVTTSYGRGGAMVRTRDGRGARAGEVDWANDGTLSSHFPTPVLADGRLYGFHGRQETGGRLRCVEAKTGRVHWEYDTPGMGSVVVAGREGVVLWENGELMVFPLGTERFAARVRAQAGGTGIRAMPAISGGRLYLRDKSRLICLDVANGAGR